MNEAPLIKENVSNSIFVFCAVLLVVNCLPSSFLLHVSAKILSFSGATFRTQVVELLAAYECEKQTGMLPCSFFLNLK
jgi:hypothetical protein